jgi:hypothetical protein
MTSWNMSEIETKRYAMMVLVVVAVIGVGICVGSQEGARAQSSASKMTANQNQTNIMMTGPNITGSISLGPIIAKAIASQIHVSLANASTTAEKAVGTNAHAAAIRIGVFHGFLVWMALILDGNNNFHGVIVDPGNGKVLSSVPVSVASMMRGGMGFTMMGPGM